MQKKLFVIIICFVCFYNLVFSHTIKYGYSYNYPSEYGTIIINKDSYTMESLGGKENILKETYKANIYEKNNYIWLENVEQTNKKYIILTCSVRDIDFLTLVCSNKSSAS